MTAYQCDTIVVLSEYLKTHRPLQMQCSVCIGGSGGVDLVVDEEWYDEANKLIDPIRDQLKSIVYVRMWDTTRQPMTPTCSLM